MGLERDMFDQDDVSEHYKRLGFKKERDLYSLNKEGKPKAITIVNLSNIGLNLLALINCIKVCVLDPDDLSKDIFHLTLSMLSIKYEQTEMSVPLYPVSYADS